MKKVNFKDAQFAPVHLVYQFWALALYPFVGFWFCRKIVGGLWGLPQKFQSFALSLTVLEFCSFSCRSLTKWMTIFERILSAVPFSVIFQQRINELANLKSDEWFMVRKRIHWSETGGRGRRIHEANLPKNKSECKRPRWGSVPSLI